MCVLIKRNHTCEKISRRIEEAKSIVSDDEVNHKEEIKMALITIALKNTIQQQVDVLLTVKLKC